MVKSATVFCLHYSGFSRLYWAKAHSCSLSHRCDGKKVCELNMNTVRTTDPCNGIYKYLETNYTCLPASQSHIRVKLPVKQSCMFYSVII